MIVMEISFPKVNYNIRSADKDLPYHPAVKATWILEHISLDNDVIFIFQVNSKQS